MKSNKKLIKGDSELESDTDRSSLPESESLVKENKFEDYQIHEIEELDRHSHQNLFTDRRDSEGEAITRQDYVY